MTTDRSDHRATLPSDPVLRNSTPTPAGPGGAASVSSRVVSSLPLAGPLQVALEVGQQVVDDLGRGPAGPSNRRTGFRQAVRRPSRSTSVFAISLASSGGNRAERGREGRNKDRKND